MTYQSKGSLKRLFPITKDHVGPLERAGNISYFLFYLLIVTSTSQSAEVMCLKEHIMQKETEIKKLFL